LNLADVKLLQGKKNGNPCYFRSMSAVKHLVGGKKQVFVPGSGPNYPFKNLVGFLSESKSSVDMGLLVAYNNAGSLLSEDDAARSAKKYSLSVTFTRIRLNATRCHLRNRERKSLSGLGDENSAVTGGLAPLQSFFGVVYEHREGLGVGRPPGSLSSSFKKIA
jgi:hypothetical protein